MPTQAAAEELQGIPPRDIHPNPDLCAALAVLLGESSESGAGHARVLIERFGLATLSRMSIAEIRGQAEISAGSAELVVAAFSVGRGLDAGRRVRAQAMRSPAQIYRWMLPLMRGLEQEQFYTLILDTRHRLLESVRVSEGTLSSSLVHPREVFRAAIRAGAAAVVAVHNHPSGDPEPSEEDRQVTRRLLESGRLLGIPLLDHVVLGEGSWVSMRERMSFE